jgi:hypothetical protein
MLIAGPETPLERAVICHPSQRLSLSHLHREAILSSQTVRTTSPLIFAQIFFGPVGVKEQCLQVMVAPTSELLSPAKVLSSLALVVHTFSPCPTHPPCLTLYILT